MRIAMLLSLLLLLLAVGAAGAERRKVDKRAMDALKNADKLVYRPLEEGLKDISLEFEVLTNQGKMKALWMHRVGSPRVARRTKATVKNIAERKRRRLITGGLKEYFDLVTYPILLKPFAGDADGMNVEWKDSRGGMTVLTPFEPGASRFNRIAYVWNEAGLPREISWSRMVQDEEDDDPYRIELTATSEWKKIGRKYFLGMLNSDRTGTRVIAKYEYAKVGGVLVPSKVTRINPFVGEDDLKLTNVKVNEGIPDEEFRKW